MTKLTFALLACFGAAALAARAQTPDPNHTVVRFEILTGGTNFGNVDIELFDQEKPETVRNFLMYVYSGAYSNLVLHRLDPGFVVQAGHVHVDDPASTSPFTTYPAWTDFGRITNEYSVGPQLSNSYGTIAMARVGGQINSASHDWFINLADNPFLNSVDGGFTVFGRVVNTTGSQDGTNLLNYFNTFTTNNIDRVFIPDYGEQLAELPVTTNRVQNPAFNELFTVRASVIQGNTVGDKTAPTLQVTQPGGTFITTSNSTITIAGTAADNQAVARVLYDSPAGSSLVASGRENWSVNLAVNSGTNKFTFRSVDYFGNVSSDVEVIVLVQEPPADPNHTVVRFNVRNNGTNFGVLDVELFDQEKPETVRNFLLYVYTGVYSNLVLHDLGRDTNGVSTLQAGHVVIGNTTSTNPFTSYIRGRDYGQITNEYDVEPRLSNAYGTIGIAQPGSTDFFFNLTNNSSLDTRMFNVFGRVRNTTTSRSGTNLLNYFDSRTFNNGLATAFLFQYGFEFFQLPVSAHRPQVTYADLFTVNASVIQRGIAFTKENIVPSVNIAEPIGNLRTETASIAFTGTASDDTEVARVFIDTPKGRFAAAGRTDWTANLELTPGTNKITIRSIDWSGNQSAAATRTVFYSVPRTVSLEIQGDGTVAGLTDGQTLELGVTYKLVARPKSRGFFNGWRGDVFSNSRTYYFTMREGVTNIIATFTPTLLNLTRGTYTGLFFPPHTNDVPRSAGSISFSLSPSGVYFGRLTPVGANYAIRGQFDASGNTIITGQRGADLLVLQLTLFPASNTISGLYSDGHFVSSVFLRLAPRFGPTNPAPAGNYSFVIDPPADPDAAVGAGYGSGTATIDGTGRIKMTGVLGNGTAIRQNTRLLEQGQWPFVVSASGGREAALGWVTLNTNSTLNGNMRLISRTFQGGTNQTSRLSGSLFTPPSQMRLFNWTNGLLTISGGGVPPINAEVILNEDGLLTVPSNPHNIRFSVPDAKGALNGNFTHPVTQAVTPLRGAVVQAENKAAGSFGTVTNRGLFIIRAP